jgi:hypothetical protein
MIVHAGFGGSVAFAADPFLLTLDDEAISPTVIGTSRSPQSIRGLWKSGHADIRSAYCVLAATDLY